MSMSTRIFNKRQRTRRAARGPSLRVFDTSVLLHATDQGYTSSQAGRYLEEHIPGAAFIDLSQDWSDTTSGLNNTLPGIDALSRRLATTVLATTIWWFLLFQSSHVGDSTVAVALRRSYQRQVLNVFDRG